MEHLHRLVHDEAIRRTQPCRESTLKGHSAHNVLAAMRPDSERLNLFLHRCPPTVILADAATRMRNRWRTRRMVAPMHVVSGGQSLSIAGAMEFPNCTFSASPQRCAAGTVGDHVIPQSGP